MTDIKIIIDFPVVSNPSWEAEFLLKNSGLARLDSKMPSSVKCMKCGHVSQIDRGLVYFVPYKYGLWWNKGSLFKSFFTSVIGVETPHCICQNVFDCNEPLQLVEVDGEILGYPLDSRRRVEIMETVIKSRLEEEYGRDPRKWSKEVLRTLNPR